MTHDDAQVDEVLARLERPARSYWVPLMIALTVLLLLSITTVILAVVVASGGRPTSCPGLRWAPAAARVGLQAPSR